MAEQRVFRVDTKVPRGERPRYYEVAADNPGAAAEHVERVERGLADAQPGNGSKARRAREVGNVSEL